VYAGEGTLRDDVQWLTIVEQTPVSGMTTGRAVKRALTRKHRGKSIPALKAAGLSLALASEGSMAATAPALDATARKAGASHSIVLREDEIFDVSLATFYVSDKEAAGAFGARGRLIKVTGCCLFACLAGQAASENNASSPPVSYSPQVPRPIGPAHKPVRKKR
jgi:hypothetical protein